MIQDWLNMLPPFILAMALIVSSNISIGVVLSPLFINKMLAE